MTRTSVIRSAFAMASVLCLWAWTAQAQQACVPRDRAVLQLDQFEEQVAGRGLTANGSRVLELFVSESGTVCRERHHPTAGANPARQLSFQPVAIGASYGGNDIA